MTRALLTLIVAAVIGCGEKAAPTPPEQAEPVAAEPTAAQPIDEAPGDEPPSEELSGGTPASDEPLLQAPATPPSRLAIFTPDGPMLVDLSVLIDGVPAARLAEAYAERLVQLFDADADGESRWRELTDEATRRRIEALTGSRLEAADVDDSRRLYDADGDGRVDAAEAVAWLERSSNADTPRLALSVLGRRAFEPDPRSAPTWRVIDGDRDGALSSDEIERTAGRLLGRDSNDDLAISPAELLNLDDLLLRRDRLIGLDRGRRSSNEYLAGYVLRTPRDTLDVRDAVALLRVGQDYVDRGAFASAGPLFDRLDTDGSGFLLDTEWHALASLPPTLMIAARFAAPTPPEVEVEITEAGDFSPIIERRSGGVVNLPRGAVVISVADAGRQSPDRFDDVAKAVSAEPIDADAFATLTDTPDGVSFEDLDLNADGRLASDEVEVARVVMGGLERLSFGATVAAGDDPMFALLDTSGDGRLGEREIRRAGDLLATLAGDDGTLQPIEAPWRMRVTIHRGPLAVATGGSMTRVDPAAGATPPRWFLGADYNADGVVSRAEHIGPLEAFDRLDADGDGFLDAAEATAGSPPASGK
ncbi:MAG: hypothetical protein AAFV43_00520 [Planctomycetota bacterium]